MVGYKILRGGVYVGTTTTGTTFADTGLTASTTYAYTIKAYDAAGNVSNASNIATSTTGAYADGFAAAPTGTAHPTLLQGYAVRAPWRVAGVDYPVGPNPGVTLKDPATISNPNVSISGRLITVTGSTPVTLNGYDFSIGSVQSAEDYWIAYEGTGGLTITNSKFQATPRQLLKTPRDRPEQLRSNTLP